MAVKKQQAARTASSTKNVEESTYLEMLRTCDQLTRRVSAVLKTEDLSPTQYNILRVLRGAPEGLPCGEIANRLITRDPDITRLLDRMEKRGLISRCRVSQDRRMVLTRISEEGLEALGRLDDPVQEAHRSQLGHLGQQKLKLLSTLLRTAREQS
ncbi:MAG TPA: MarR family transcriptional regulator [Terriglobales bacterium]|jgi:DNA-binding MarR family transcriptional regulator